ncbi:MAG TPA: alpha/beta fold hydrolase [Thermoanaerobaculia bacterium]|nr:alpha/beta fold hydrolase [Thermoanaerobaculia bacterium]
MIRTGLASILFLFVTTLAQGQAPSEVEVTFAGYQGFQLAGSLSLPAPLSKDGAPGVLLLPGSGPTDRDGNQPPYLSTDLLKEMSRRLVREGFAVLRFDKRAAAVYANRWPADLAAQDAFFAWEAFTGDARAALDFLRGRPEVDRTRTAIVGHSEGGLIALQLGSDLAAAGSPPAALVLASTAATKLDEVVRVQMARGLENLQANEADRKLHLDALDGAIRSILESGTVPADLPFLLRPLFPPNASRLLRSYFTIDPAALARSYPGPVLVLHGAMDAQIPAEEHTDKMLGVLASRAGGVHERVIIPNASHNLKPAASLTDFGFAGDVVPGALDALAGFLSRALR